MAGATYAGFGGMLSMFAKLPVDMIYKNKPQGMVFPLDEFATDMVQTMSHAATAIANDPNLNMLKLSQAVSLHLLSSNFQLGRVVYNQAINNGIITGTFAEKKLLADKLGQLRRFDMVEGLPYNEQDQAGNPFMNLEQKSLKLEQDPMKYAQKIPGVVRGIIDAYHNNPDVMMRKLQALKQNQYATFPSMQDTPIQFMKYISFLGKTESPAYAQQALLDYLKRKALNQAKASVIP